jgi:hypothetical protein
MYGSSTTYRLNSAILARKFLAACFALALAVAAAPGIGNAASSSAYAQSGPSNRAKRIEVGVPAGAVLESVTLRVAITPPKGVVVIYGSPTSSRGVRVHGPAEDVEVPTTEPVIYVDEADGATGFSIATLRYKMKRQALHHRGG